MDVPGLTAGKSVINAEQQQQCECAVWIYALLARDAFPTPIKAALVSPHHWCQQSSHALDSSQTNILDGQHALHNYHEKPYFQITNSGFRPP